MIRQIWLALTVFVSLNLAAQFKRGDSSFDDLLSKWKAGQRPGIAVALIQNGHVRYKQTLGYADLAAGTPVRSDTRFLVGSISKQFTATAILMLAHDGPLRLDDAASRFVPDLPEFARAITIRQLLHHTGGLPDHEELLAGKIDREFFISSAVSRRVPFTVSDAFGALRRSAGLRFPPGEKWEYSNTGYLVLGQVIERACRCSYAGFLRRNIFGPLGMKNSQVIPLPPAKITRLASAYTRSRGEWADISYSPLNFMVGHDGVVSTLDDMTLWATAIGRGKLLPAAEGSVMFQAGSTNDGRPTGYGFGWRLAGLKGARVFQHEGCWSGFRNGIVLSSDASSSAIVLTNAADAGEFWNCDDGLNLARELLHRGRQGAILQ
jgi:CubicO group peptidase (beta-lactamase class C family)